MATEPEVDARPRPVAVRALLLVAGVILGLVALMTVLSATTSGST